MARLITLSRPEGGAEHGVQYVVRHNCPQGVALRASMGREVDELTFNVGLFGWEMPLETPFPVEAEGGCPACGATVAAWFQWTGPKVVSSRLIVP